MSINGLMSIHSDLSSLVFKSFHFISLCGKPTLYISLLAIDDVRHLVLQCPRWQNERTEMLNEIDNIPDGSGHALLNSQCDLVIALLGKVDPDLSYEQKVTILTISSKYISKMYFRKTREGIG